MITLNINGKSHQVDVDPETPLLWVITESLGLTGVKYGCGIGECGGCTVLVDGRPTLSCRTSVASVQGMDIVTIEGLQGVVADALRKAWIQEDVVQCGYCQPAQILTAAALLRDNPDPDDADMDAAMSGVLCRCGSYQGIRDAIQLAAREIRHGCP